MALQRTDEFIRALTGLPMVPAQIVTEAERDYLIEAYPNINSRRAAFTTYRAAIKSGIPEPFASACCSILSLTKEQSIAFRNDYNRSVANEQRALRPIHDVDGHIDKCERLLKAGSYCEVILGIAGLTGRRVGEVAVTARFEVADPITVVFYGQTKTRGRTDAVDGYEMPTLCAANTIFEALARLRDWKPELAAVPEDSQEQVAAKLKLFHDRASKPLNAKARKHFGDDIKPKDLRSIYGELAYLFFGPDNIAKKRFMSDLFGHGPDDNLTGESYLDFYIDDPGYK